MRIMGVDPSISCTGISLPSGETLAIKPRSKGDWRIKEVGDHVLVAAQACRADLVVIEGLSGNYRGGSARIIPMLHGGLRDRLMCHSIPYMDLHPMSLKRFATGTGGADKPEMALAARRRLGRTYRTHDECDADWCRVAGRMVYGLGELTEYGSPGQSDWLRCPPDQLDALRRTLKGVELIWPEVGRYSPWPKVAVR